MNIPTGIWREWGASPLEVALMLLPLVWYAMGVRALWRSAGTGGGVSRTCAASFASGIAVLAVALASPVDAAAEALFSGHMVQHLLLILVAAPLLVLGAPSLPAVWALPRASRMRAARWWRGAVALRAMVHAVTSPGAAFVLHFIALWFWHMPAPYQAALRSPGLHALEHASFLGTAVLFWWTVATPLGRPRAGEATGIAMIVGTLMHSGALGALLMFARVPWYPAHDAGARAWGMTAMDDQQLAGLIMWIPAGAVYVTAAAWLFVRWLRHDEQRQSDHVTARRQPRAPRREEVA